MSQLIIYTDSKTVHVGRQCMETFKKPGQSSSFKQRAVEKLNHDHLQPAREV